MIFFSLYKTTGNWSNERKHPKNHLAYPGTFDPLCGAKEVSNMGGSFEFNITNGNWYVESPITYQHDIKMGQHELSGICKICMKKALKLIENSKQ